MEGYAVADVSDIVLARAAELLPPELRAFLRSPAPQSLTVRGAPGVGKTTFALGTLAAFPGARTFISTRVPLESIRRQFGWMEHVPGPPIRSLEFVRFRSHYAIGAPSVEHLRQTLEARASDLVDVSSVLNLPHDLQEHLDGEPPGPRLIVLDSWEAWVENILGSSSINISAPTTRWELERAMLDQLLATGASVLMVVERDERSRFDYITDGSVLLTSAELDGREERWLEITKLRGLKIQSRSYPFTLEDARFRTILPPPVAPAPAFRAEVDPEPGATLLWPGSAAFAQEFGRVPGRGALLIEADPEAPVRALWRIVAPALDAAFRAGGRIVLRPPHLLGPEELWEGLRTIGPAEELARRVRVVVTSSTVRAGPPASIFSLPEMLETPEHVGHGERSVPRSAPDPVDDVVRIQVVPEFLNGSAAAGLRNLIVLFPATFADLRPDGRSDPYLRVPGEALRQGLEFSTIIVMRSDDPMLNEARTRAATHLVVRSRRGQILLYGVRPWTPAFVVRPTDEGSALTIPYELVPMV